MTTNGRIDPADAELEPGETLLWSGQPPGGVLFRPTDALLIPFTLLWGGFAFFWEGLTLLMAFSAVRSGEPTGFVTFLFPIFGVPFVLMGCYLIFGRFFFDARARERTSYALTNDRIIIVSGVFSREVKSLQLRGLSEIAVTERADRSGTIKLGAGPGFPDFFAGLPGMKGRMPPMLEAIPEARNVYRKILDAQKEAAH